jgi:hypothetical protein
VILVLNVGEEEPIKETRQLEHGDVSAYYEEP